jgi:hypothetical protein
VELPANLRGGAAHRVVDKLVRAGLLEEVRARDSLLEWRRDDANGPLALRITKHGLEAVGVEDAAAPEPREPDGDCGSGRMRGPNTPSIGPSYKRADAPVALELCRGEA